MENISNKTLATLLVIAIIVSIGGTLIGFNQLAGISPLGWITGFATASGRVNLTIPATVAVTIINAIDFGSGVPAQNQNCTMESNLTSGSRTGSNCNGPDWNTSIATAAKRAILIMNSGTTYLNATLTAAVAATTWLNSPNNPTWGIAQYAIISPTGQTTLGVDTSNLTQNNDGCPSAKPSGWQTLAIAASNVCNSTTAAFEPASSVLLVAKVIVPPDIIAGEHNVTVTVTGNN